MSIQAHVTELTAIRAELQSLNNRRVKMKKREKELIKEISDFLKSHNQPGVKYQGIALLLEEKEKHEPKKNKERDMDAMNILKKYGIQEPEKALKEVMDARKGELVLKESLKLKKIKNAQ